MGHGVLDPPTPRVGGTCFVGGMGSRDPPTPTQGTRRTAVPESAPGDGGQETFSVKGQIVNVFGFAGSMISVVQKTP